MISVTDLPVESDESISIVLEEEDFRSAFLEVLWSGKVKSKWEAPEGLFEKSASAIASTLAKASKNLKQAMSRLNFFINRAGKNLSKKRKAELEKVKGLLRKKFA